MNLRIKTITQSSQLFPLVASLAEKFTIIALLCSTLLVSTTLAQDSPLQQTTPPNSSPQTPLSKGHLPMTRSSAQTDFTITDDEIVFTSPGVPDYLKAIRLTDNLGYLSLLATDLLGSPGAAIYLAGNGTTLPGQMYFDSGAHDSAALIFRTAQTGGVIEERLRITATGNVGVGTASPGSKLTVNGVIESLSGGVRFPDGSVQATATLQGAPGPQGPQGPQGDPGPPGPRGDIGGSGTINQLSKFTSSTTIGNSAISEVGGNVQIAPNSTNFALRVDQGTSGHGILSYVNTTSSGRTVFAADSNVTGFWVKGNGYVGIGTPNPNVKLDVNGPSDDLTAAFRSDPPPANPFINQLALHGSGINSEARLGFLTTHAGGVSHHMAVIKSMRSPEAGGHLVFQTREPGLAGIPERMRITDSGNVGIGTTDPRTFARLAVFESFDNNDGVWGQTSGPGNHGVHGVNTATTGDSFGVIGDTSSTSGVGVVGRSSATSGASFGVRGLTSSTGGAGVVAISAGSSPANLGLLVFGRGSFTGIVTKAGGSFKIDHPRDPANKYLSHSFVESPDMMDIYNGNVTTDEQGAAVVTLPDYFTALNRDYRYQLTVIGQFAQAIIESEISDNRFTIQTDKPQVKVSWQVTGIRQDAWANKHRIPVEEDKPESERGYYLHPELFNAPEEKGVEWGRNPEMMKRMKEEREKQMKEAQEKSKEMPQP